MASFTALPSYPFEFDEMARVRATKFGDGYEQRTDEDINVLVLNYPLTFANRSESEKDDILAFLRARRGKESFDWTPPDGEAGKYVCRRWKCTRVAAGAYTITCAFEQIFEP